MKPGSPHIAPATGTLTPPLRHTIPDYLRLGDKTQAGVSAGRICARGRCSHARGDIGRMLDLA